jgi:hypothetical protein
MQRLCAHFPRLVWLNPEDPRRWEYAPSVGLTRALVGERMFGLTIAGLDQAIAALRTPLNSAPVGAAGRFDATAVTKDPPPRVP